MSGKGLVASSIGMPWGPHEDALLRAAVAKYGESERWKDVALEVPGRTNKSCRKRWLHSLSPNIKKSAWTRDEDEQLITLHRMHGQRWALIARAIPGRTDDACSKRYRDALDPSLNHGEWTPQEDQRLFEAKKKHGDKWVTIGQALNRSSLGCRNRWRMLQRNKTTLPPPCSPLSPPSPPSPPLPFEKSFVYTPISVEAEMPAWDDFWEVTQSHPATELSSPEYPFSDEFWLYPEMMSLPAQHNPLTNTHGFQGQPPPFQWTSSSLSTALTPPQPSSAMLGLSSHTSPSIPNHSPYISPNSDLTPNASFGTSFDAISPQLRPLELDHYYSTDVARAYGVESTELESPLGLGSTLVPFMMPQHTNCQPFHSPSSLSAALIEPARRPPTPPPPPPPPPAPLEIPIPEVQVHSPEAEPTEAIGEKESGGGSPGSGDDYVVSAHEGGDNWSPGPNNSLLPNPVSTSSVVAPPSTAQPLDEQPSMLFSTHYRPHVAKEGKASKPRSVNRLSASLAVCADPDVKPYVCGHRDCFPVGAKEGTSRFRISSELSEHSKSVHNSALGGKDPFRCGLSGCTKSWRSLPGLQYHLQVSRVHFQAAVQSNFSPSAAGDMTLLESPEPGAVQLTLHGKIKKAPKVHLCPQCGKSYKQLSGLRYHLVHGHDDEDSSEPIQLDEIPPSLEAKLRTKTLGDPGS